MNNRTFDIIAFISRRGRLIRMTRDHYEFDNADNVPGEIMRRTSAQCAMGRSVLVFESGCIKADWSRVTDNGIHALLTCDETDYIHFIRNVVELRGLSRVDFLRHVDRTFAARISDKWRRQPLVS